MGDIPMRELELRFSRFSTGFAIGLQRISMSSSKVFSMSTVRYRPKAW